jgi:hypothetical protein
MLTKKNYFRWWILLPAIASSFCRASGVPVPSVDCLNAIVRPRFKLALWDSGASYGEMSSRIIRLFSPPKAWDADIPPSKDEAIIRDLSVFNSERIKYSQITSNKIRAGNLSDYDALIVSDGKAEEYTRVIRPAGVKAIQAFVGKGGVYVGVGAGSSLAREILKKSLIITNQNEVSGGQVSPLQASEQAPAFALGTFERGSVVLFPAGAESAPSFEQSLSDAVLQALEHQRQNRESTPEDPT